MIESDVTLLPELLPTMLSVRPASMRKEHFVDADDAFFGVEVGFEVADVDDWWWTWRFYRKATADFADCTDNEELPGDLVCEQLASIGEVACLKFIKRSRSKFGSCQASNYFREMIISETNRNFASTTRPSTPSGMNVPIRLSR